MFAKNKHYLLLHFIVLIWGCTGIMGAIITASSEKIMFYRTLFTAITIYGYALYKKVNLKISSKALFELFGTGAVIAIHWYCFYESIKVSNVSVCMVTYSSASFFMAFLEPLIYKRKIVWYEVIFGTIVIGTLAYIFNLDTKYINGILLSLVAAITAGIFALINGNMVKKYNAATISFYEILGVFIISLAYYLFSGKMTYEILKLDLHDTIWLIIMAVFATAFTFIASVEILKNISPYTVMLTVNLEPIYGIIGAYFILDESKYLSTEFYIGTVIIMVMILANGWLKKLVLPTKQTIEA